MPLFCCIDECEHGFADCKMVRFPKFESDSKVWESLIIRASNASYTRMPSHRICLCHFSSRQFVRLMPYDVSKNLKTDAFPDNFGPKKGLPPTIKAKSTRLTTKIPMKPNEPPATVPVMATPGGIAYPCNLPSTSKTVGFLIPVQTIGGQIQLPPIQNQDPNTKGQISMPVQILNSAPLLSQTPTSIAPDKCVQLQGNAQPSSVPALSTVSSLAPKILGGLKNAFSKLTPQPIQPLKETDFLPVYLKEERLEVLDDDEFLQDQLDAMDPIMMVESCITEDQDENPDLDMHVDQEETEEDGLSADSQPKKSRTTPSRVKRLGISYSPAKKSGTSRSPAKKSGTSRSPAKKSRTSRSPAKKSETSSSPPKRSLRNSRKLAPKILGGLKKAFATFKAPGSLDDGSDFLSDNDVRQGSKCAVWRISELCRLCANPKKSEHDMIPILGDLGKDLKLEEKIRQHLPSVFSGNDSRLPMQVCTRCANELNMCHKLLIRCNLADKRLNQLLQLEDQRLGSPIPCSDDVFNESEEKPGTISDDAVSHGNDAESDSDFNNLKEQADTDEQVSSIETTPLPSNSKILRNQNSNNSKNNKKCPFVSCDFVTYSIRYLTSHLDKIHHKELCRHCDALFDTNKELVDHVESIHTKTVTCEKCGELVASINMERHLKSHNKRPRQNLECHICNKSGFHKKNALELHMSRHQTEKLAKCSICNKTFFHEYDVRKHKKAIHKEDDLLMRCAECNSTFKTKSALNAHMQMRHLLEWKYSCNVCQFTCTVPQDIYTHIQNQHSNENYTTTVDESLFTRTSDHVCDTCNNYYPNKFCLKKHQYKCPTTKKRNVIVKSANKLKKCRFCNEVFCGPGVLRRHLRIDHKIKEDISDADLQGIGTKKGKSYECNLCKKILASKLSLQVHFRFHTKEKIYPCKICGESFYMSSHLEAHENKKHRNVTPFHCSKCPRQFYGRHLLYRHMRSHSKPLVCQYCGKNFAFGGQLRVHELIHTGERPHTCKICNRGFTQKHEMETHQLAHLQEKKFKCSNCNYKSNKLQDVVKHIEKSYAPADNVVAIRQDLSSLM